MRRCGCVKTVLQRRKSVGFFFFFFIVFSLLLTYDGEIYLLTYLLTSRWKECGVISSQHMLVGNYVENNN